MNVHRTRLLHGLSVTALLATGLLNWGCGVHTPAPTAPAESSAVAAADGTPTSELRVAIAAQQKASPDLLALGGVVGTGAGLDAAGKAEVVVMLEHAEAARAVPETVDGVRVVKLVLGPIMPWSLVDSYRPVPIGVSAGNANECLPGTIGCVLQRGSRRFLLSANHVFARQNQGAIGEAIVQPSLPDLDPDCGPPPPSAVVATLADFQTIVYDAKTPNYMDAAIAEVTSAELTCATPSSFYGSPSSTPAIATNGMNVMKVGRTTELTRARIKAVNVKTKITFPSGTALFVDQILTTQQFGNFGDSGALVVTDDGRDRPIGIVIGGGNNGSAIVSPIGPILARFDARICTR